MIKLITFTHGNEKLLEFKFNECNITYFGQTQWVNIFSTKQKITIKGNSFIAFDEDIKGVTADSTYFSMAKTWIQNFYKEHDKTLIVSTLSDEPLYIFHGEKISILHTEDAFTQFKIDDKALYLNNLHWTILTHNE